MLTPRLPSSPILTPLSTTSRNPPPPPLSAISHRCSSSYAHERRVYERIEASREKRERVVKGVDEAVKDKEVRKQPDEQSYAQGNGTMLDRTAIESSP